MRSLRVARKETPRDNADAAALAEWAGRVEGFLRREQAQWGQLTEEADRAAGSG
jgi:hypothetical protein